MEYQTFIFNSHKIYKTKIFDLDINSIINEYYINEEYYRKIMNADIIMSPNIRKMYLACYQATENIYKKELNKEIISGYQSGWFFKSTPLENTGEFHNHLTLSRNYSEIKSDYVWTFYLIVPNNCTGNQGHLIFKDTNGDEFSIEPEEGFLYVFKSDLLHRGNESLNSTKDRLLAVANIAFNFGKKIVY